MLTAFGLTCSAQEARIVERLADGSYVVSIAGVEHRAFDAAKMRELEKRKVDLDAALRINAEKDAQIKELGLQVELKEAQKALIQQKADSFKADFERSQEDAKRNFGLFVGERELRVEAQQFIPHGQTNGFWGKVLNTLDSPASQAFWKLAVPTYQMMRCR